MGGSLGHSWAANSLPSPTLRQGPREGPWQPPYVPWRPPPGTVGLFGLARVSVREVGAGRLAAMQPRDPILLSAQFDPRLETYFMLQAQALLLCTFIGIPIMPLWFLFARGIHRRQYLALGCELTTRSLVVRRGHIFKVQQNIPLDKVTDLAVYEGPLLRALGLTSMRIETAGGGQATATGQAFLPGVVNLEAFRERVLAQRDAIVLGADAAPQMLDDGVRRVAPPASDDVLREIRDSVLRIERKLHERG